MLSHSLLAGVLSASFAYALPADVVERTSSHIQKRNPCDGKDAEPILYHNYKNDVCPPPMKFASPGFCEMKRMWNDGWSPFRGHKCEGFCEENVKFKYGRESIFLANPYCHGPMTCTISDTATTAWSIGATISPLTVRLSDIFTSAVSGSITRTKTTARAINKAVTLKQDECGYFTWIPILKESCGTHTGEGRYRDVVRGHPGGLCVDGKSTPNTCVTTPNPIRGTADDPQGVTVLVRVDCKTHAPLPADFQDPAYNNDGVPLDRGAYNSFAETFEQKDKMFGQTSEIDCNVQDPNQSPQFEDCSTALGVGMLHPVIGLLQGRKGGQWWASYVHSCALQIEYEQDWTKDCIVGISEVLRAAAGIMNTCKVQNGRIGGSRRIRNDGKCNATLRIANTAGRQPPQDMSPLVG